MLELCVTEYGLRRSLVLASLPSPIWMMPLYTVCSLRRERKVKNVMQNLPSYVLPQIILFSFFLLAFLSSFLPIIEIEPSTFVLSYILSHFFLLLF